MVEKQDEKSNAAPKQLVPPKQKELDQAKDRVERLIVSKDGKRYKICEDDKKFVINKDDKGNDKLEELPATVVETINSNLVQPLSVDDRVTNRLIEMGKYTNFSFYSNEDTVREAFDQRRWPDILKNTLHEEHERLDKVVDGLLGERAKDATLFDCGCGTGRHLPWAIDRFKNAIGMDYSKIVIGTAAKDVVIAREFDAAKKIRLVCGDVAEIPAVQDGSVDVAICLFNTLGIIDSESHKEIMKHLNRILKAPTSDMPSFFFLGVYLDNDKTKEMQTIYYTNGFDYVIDTTDKVENGRRYTLAHDPNNPDNTLTSQRFTRGYIESMLDGTFGILEFKPFSGTMAYVVAVPIKDREAMGKELLKAVRAGKMQEAEVLLAGKAYIEQRDSDGNTPLAIAAKRGDDAIAKRLIKAGADVNAKNYVGETPLMHACDGKHGLIVRMLIRRRANVNLEDSLGESALMKACRSGDERTVQHLLDKNAYVGSEIFDELSRVLSEEKKARLRNRPFSLPIVLAAENGHPGIVKLLTDRRIRNRMRKIHYSGEDFWFNVEKVMIAIESDSSGKNAIVAAAKNGNLEVVKILVRGVVEHPSDKGDKYEDKEGMTPLMAAAQHGHANIVEFLLKNKEYAAKAINHRDRDGKTALMHALGAKQFEIAKILIEAGTDVNLPENDWAGGGYPLHLAMNFEDPKAVELTEYLLAYGADPNLPDKRGRTPIFLACAYGKAETAKALLMEGADPNKEVDGEEPLLLGAYSWGFSGKDAKGGAGLLRALVKAGADPHVQNAKGGTLLHKMARGGNAEVADALLEEFKLDVNGEEHAYSSHTPLMIAYDYRKPEVAEVLLSHGARYESGNLGLVRFIKKILRNIESKTAGSAVDGEQQ